MNITLNNIHKRFGPVHANKGITAAFGEGQIVGILGENGAGKSTLMKILSGFQPADSGEILLDNNHIRYDGPQSALAYGIGMLQQDPLDVGAFTVLENYVFGRSDRFLPKWRDAEQELLQLVQRFGFDLDPDTPIENLSIAQRQQLEIIRLLGLGVQALILDEPTTGISAEQKATLFDALRRLAHQDKLVVLLVSHKLEDVIDLCDSVIVLRSGENVGSMLMPETHTLSPALMNETKARLVQMMFGQELPQQKRQSAATSRAIMQLNNLHVQDKRLHIAGVSLTVHAGEVIGLAGLDGSGQELFMRAVCGLTRTAEGKIHVGNQDLTGKPYRQFMTNGVVFGAAGRLEEGLIAGLTLTEHIALVDDTQAFIDWQTLSKATQEKIAHYNVRGRPSDEIQPLSGGNQQRVLMALLPEQPELLILEQPTRGLDVDSAHWIWEQLLFRRQHGTAIIFSSPELDELVAYSDRILVFYSGRIHEVTDVSGTTIDQLGHLIGGEFSQ